MKENEIRLDIEVSTTPTSPLGVDAPLAARLRPRTLGEIVGQKELLRPGTPLHQLLEGHSSTSLLLYGPPGTGKTTIARLLATSSRHFVALSALSSGVKELREVIDGARRERARTTILFIDEIHRFSKSQQDALLGAVEEGSVVLLAATTENPSFSVVDPLLSRLLVIQLQPLTPDDLREVVRRALTNKHGLDGTVSLTADAEAALIRLADGDARSALTVLEASATGVLAEGSTVVDIPALENVVSGSTTRYDRQGDQHHDVTSAYIKSVRGSDPDAALHYLARMLVAGEDPHFIARRLLIHASEDIGLADPSALQTAIAAAQAVQLLGMPEARLALAQATLHLAMAPKSNAVIAGIDTAMSDVRRGGTGEVPPHLRFGRYSGAAKLGNGVGYRYPHRDPNGVLAQQYPPNELVGKDYYKPAPRGHEEVLQHLIEGLRATVRHQ